MDHAGHKYDYREFMGNAHFMKQLHRQYDFPVNVFQENEDGSRVLLRTEASASA